MRGRNIESEEIKYNTINHSTLHRYRVVYECIHYQKYIAFTKDENNVKKKSTNEEIRILISVRL